MGFTPQPNLWQCGPFALKHALLMLGVFVDEKLISRLAGTTNRSGTDEVQMARAARMLGCKLRVVRKRDAVEARRELTSHLRRGHPCLVCAYEWSHWVAVVKEERGRFIVLDSREKRVLAILSWSRFRSCWVYHQRADYDKSVVETVYDLHALVPQFRAQTRARFSSARAKYLRRPENREFARRWNEYVEDLLALCKPRTALSAKVLSLGEFLRRHADMMVDQVAFWHGAVETRRVRKILRNMRFVADTYGLVIHEGDEKRAIAGFAALLALWAASQHGVKNVYGSAPRKRARRRR